MTPCIIESILAWFAAAIDAIEPGLDPKFTLASRRPRGLQLELEQLHDGTVDVYAGAGHVESVTLGGVASVRQEIICRICADQVTADAASVDTRLLAMFSAVAAAIIGGNTGGSACGGLAKLAEIRDWIFADAEGVTFCEATFEVLLSANWEGFTAVA